MRVDWQPDRLPGLSENLRVGQALSHLRQRLAAVSETPSLDAQVLLAHVLGRGRAWILAHSESPLGSGPARDLKNKLEHLLAGEPLPYVLGQWEFYGLRFSLSPAVLIPRPETELLVDTAREWLENHPGRRRVADVGTGSGCIAVALAAHEPELHVVASDLSLAAVRLARENAHALGVSDRIDFIQSDLLSHLCPGAVDLICANPPYIPSQTLQDLPLHGKEPGLALDGGPDGIRLIQRLLEQAPHRLAPGGALLVEIEASLGQKAHAVASQIFPAACIALLSDLAGRDRLLKIVTN